MKEWKRQHRRGTTDPWKQKTSKDTRCPKCGNNDFTQIRSFPVKDQPNSRHFYCLKCRHSFEQAV